MEYEYSSFPGSGLWSNREREHLVEISHFYSSHYGIWRNSNNRVKLSVEKLKAWLVDGSYVVEARKNGDLIGYAIVVHATQNEKKRYKVAWVTQFVVHEQHRNKGIGKKLLFSAWSMSDFHTWGIVSSNPFAVRALEKATGRRCEPARIKKEKRMLLNFGQKHVSYIKKGMKSVVDNNISIINTSFDVDHSLVPSMIVQASSDEKKWLLGDLPDGYEWFAFTFQDQPRISLTMNEIDSMLNASAQTVKSAYARMTLDEKHAWAKHTKSEVERIAAYCRLQPGDAVLDFGCGAGRYAIALARMGFDVTGVDYLENHIAKAERDRQGAANARFLANDCRSVSFDQQFDAVLCLYDVIGSFREPEENEKIVTNISRHLKPGGHALISVMNFELTKNVATKYFSLHENPDELLNLKASAIMESTGNIFDPRYFMIENSTQIVYRREQFTIGRNLPEEFIVVDKRYTMDEITGLCESHGLKVLWSRFVRAGDWETALGNIDKKAKEILVLCQKAW